MYKGWIKIHRPMLEWEWYSDINTTRLFIHLLLKANHEDKKWRGIIIHRGEIATSIKTLSFETALSPRQVRTSLNKLKSTSELTSQSTNIFTVISIVNYDSYQKDDKRDDKPAASERQTSDKRMTTTKELKNIRTKELKKEEPPISPIGGLLPDWINQEEWNDYVLMRKNIKKPMTKRAMKLAITKLDKLRQSGNDPNEILQNSIFNSWQGLFAIKNNQDGGKHGNSESPGRRAIRDAEQIIRDRNAGVERLLDWTQ